MKWQNMISGICAGAMLFNCLLMQPLSGSVAEKNAAEDYNVDETVGIREVQEAIAMAGEDTKQYVHGGFILSSEQETITSPEVPADFQVYYDAVQLPLRNSKLQYGYVESYTESEDSLTHEVHMNYRVNYLTMTSSDFTFRDAVGSFAMSYADAQKWADALGIEIVTKTVDTYDEFGQKNGTALGYSYIERFDLRGFDPSEKPKLYDTDNVFINVEDDRKRLENINQAITDDYNRKKNAYELWKKQLDALNMQPVEPERKNGDVNNDGKINAKDATIILRYAAAAGTGSTEPIENYIN